VFSQNDKLQVSCTVDERTELMSVVFRLAGAEEYITNDIPVYVSKIDSAFTKFADEPVIKMSQTMRRDFGVGYDAVMSLAINLEIKNGDVSLRSDISTSEIDKRWQCDSISKYINLLNDFYKKTDFNLFFVGNKQIYENAKANFINNVISGIKFEWYEKFYGQNLAKQFHIIISISNGGSNYGPHTKTKDGKEELFSIIGSWRVDSLGSPIYDGSVRSYVIHEFNHSFCNPLVAENLLKLLPKASEFNKLVFDKMRSMGYGEPYIYLNELMVRACVIKYGEYVQGKESEEFWIAQERNDGFLWMPELIKALSNYELNRERYPTLQSFMSEIVILQNKLNPKKTYKQIVNNQPLIWVENIKNGSQNVDVNIDSVVVKFNKPMYIGANGSSYGKKGGKEFFPQIMGAKWNVETKKEWVMYIKLQPNKEYSISFPAQFFYSEKGYYSPKETYYLDFKTADIKK
jgi:hypothetical protein